MPLIWAFQSMSEATQPADVNRTPFREVGARWRLHVQREGAESIAAFSVPAALILYLALSNGGYSVGPRSLAGIACWLLVLIGCAVLARPTHGSSRWALAALALLTVFAAWTAASMIWTENDERTAIEASRVLAYLGALAIALGLQGRGNGRRMLAGVTAALTAVCALALMSRLEPNLFPARLSGQYIPVPEIERRLAYPLNYSGGVATLATMTIPLLLLHSWAAKSQITRVLAGALVPMVLVVLWLTGSGLILAVGWVGAAVFIGFSADRLPKLASLTTGLVGGAFLSAAVVRLPALDRGLPTPDAFAQGDQLLALTVVVCIATGLAHLAIMRIAERRGRPRWSRPSRRRRQIVIAALLSGAVVFVAIAASGKLNSQFDRFRSLDNVSVDAPRLSQVTDIGSSGRYQQWRSALDAFESSPVTGIGAGTFEFWWARNGEYGGFVRDGHSLYLETLGELGIVGLVLIGTFIVLILTGGARAALRSVGAQRTFQAGALGMLATFAAAAGVDWMWELGVLPFSFMLVAAVALLPGKGWDGDPGPVRTATAWTPGWRAATVGLSLLAAILIVPPFLVQRSIDTSEARFSDGNFAGAFASARFAAQVEPFAETPRLQEALVLERAGQLDDAIAAAEAAVERGSTDWRPRLILSQLQRKAGEGPEAARTYEQARKLNPRSHIFSR